MASTAVEQQIGNILTSIPNQISSVWVNNVNHPIKDTGARSAISVIAVSVDAHTDSIDDLYRIVQGGVYYAGKTTTPLTDGSTTNPIVIDGESVLIEKAGAIVIYGESGQNADEFIWDGSKWNRLGSTNGLGDLAFSNTTSASYTPTGNVAITATTDQSASICALFNGTSISPDAEATIPEQTISSILSGKSVTISSTFSGKQATISANLQGTQATLSTTFGGTPATLSAQVQFTKSISQQNLGLSGTQATLSTTFDGTEETISGNLSMNQVSPSATFTPGDVHEVQFNSFTPQGSIQISSYKPTGSIGNVITDVNPSTNTIGDAQYANETLSILFGTAITSLGETKQSPTFTGDSFQLSGKFTGSPGTPTGNISQGGSVTITPFTPSGTFSKSYKPKGTIGNITYTPEGYVVLPAYTPEGTVTIQYTPEGTVGTITYTPSGKISTTYTPEANSVTASYAPSGNVNVQIPSRTISVNVETIDPEGTVSGYVKIPGHTHQVSFGGNAATITGKPVPMPTP